MTLHPLLSLLLKVAARNGTKIEAGWAVEIEAVLVNELNPANYTCERLRVHPLYVDQKL